MASATGSGKEPTVQNMYNDSHAMKSVIHDAKKRVYVYGAALVFSAGVAFYGLDGLLNQVVANAPVRSHTRQIETYTQNKHDDLQQVAQTASSTPGYEGLVNIVSEKYDPIIAHLEAERGRLVAENEQNATLPGGNDWILYAGAFLLGVGGANVSMKHFVNETDDLEQLSREYRSLYERPSPKNVDDNFFSGGDY